MAIANIGGVNLNYEDRGKGLPVLLAHGYTGSIEDWAMIIPPLAEKYRVMAIDHRGHGNSEAPSSQEHYSVCIFAEDLSALLQRLNAAPAVIVGHSMGGFMALQLALDHPDAVKALVLVDTSSGEFQRPPGFAELRAELAEIARTQGLEAAFEHNARHNPWMRERFEKHPQLREISRKKTLRTSVDGYVCAARAIDVWQPLTSRLPEIKVPTLIVVGEEDLPFMEPSRIMDRGIPGAKLITVPNSGHSPHEENPDFLKNELLRFLATL